MFDEKTEETGITAQFLERAGNPNRKTNSGPKGRKIKTYTF